MSKTNTTLSFLGGLVAGGLVGAATALLMAPRSGEETRTYLRENAIHLQEQAIHNAEELRAQAEATLEKTREKAQQAQKRSEAFYHEQKQRLEQAIESSIKLGKDKVAQVVHTETPAAEEVTPEQV